MRPQQLFITIAAVGFLSVALIFAWLDTPLVHHAEGNHGTSKVYLDRALRRYSQLTANMTRRIRAVEEALVLLQAEGPVHARGPAQVRQPRSEGNATAKSGKSDADEDADSDPDSGGGGTGARSKDVAAFGPPKEEGEDEPGEERDGEMSEEQRKAELEEQNKLIGFDAAKKTFQKRFRPDFRCGDRAPPLPDNEIVECDPGGESPCCSAVGWCGKSSQHCACSGCEDYQNKVELTLLGVEVASEGHECEDIAYSFGELESPEICAQQVLKQADCGRMLMFSQKYKKWGCRCCAAGSETKRHEKGKWSVYKLKVSATLKEPEDNKAP